MPLVSGIRVFGRILRRFDLEALRKKANKIKEPRSPDFRTWKTRPHMLTSARPACLHLKYFFFASGNRSHDQNGLKYNIIQQKHATPEFVEKTFAEHLKFIVICCAMVRTPLRQVFHSRQERSVRPKVPLPLDTPAGSARVVLAEFSGDLLEEETSLIACSIYRRLWSVRCLFFWIIFVGCCLAGVSAKRS